MTTSASSSGATGPRDAVLARVFDAVVQVRAGARGAHQGAGCVWARDPLGTCLVVSNAHVATAAPVTVVGRDGLSRAATLLARDATRDLALLRVEHAPESWHTIPPAQHTAPAGTVAMAIGHPHGLAYALTTGLVHARGPVEDVPGLPAPAATQSWLTLDLRLAPGNSGGPIVDQHGALMGISTMIAGGLGLAIPLADIDAFVARAGGPSHLAHGWTRAA